jgi:hypothetical protein
VREYNILVVLLVLLMVGQIMEPGQVAPQVKVAQVLHQTGRKAQSL